MNETFVTDIYYDFVLIWSGVGLLFILIPAQPSKEIATCNTSVAFYPTPFLHDSTEFPLTGRLLFSLLIYTFINRYLINFTGLNEENIPYLSSYFSSVYES